jgi:hypothetical protein
MKEEKMQDTRKRLGTEMWAKIKKKILRISPCYSVDLKCSKR